MSDEKKLAEDPDVEAVREIIQAARRIMAGRTGGQVMMALAALVAQGILVRRRKGMTDDDCLRLHILAVRHFLRGGRLPDEAVPGADYEDRAEWKKETVQ